MLDNNDNKNKTFLETLYQIKTLINQLIEQQTPKTQPATIKEITFNTLIYEEQLGNKLGLFEIAHKKDNIADKWQHAYNVLNVNNATIQNRYHGTDYQYSYWLYGNEKIYRQKLKANQ